MNLPIKYIINISIILGILGLLIGITFVLINFYHFPNYLFNAKFNMEHTGQFGDYFGGVVGTIFSLIASILLFGTLILQNEQNKFQNIELRKTEDSFNLQNFENRFFELIKLHRENVAEIGIGRVYGKRIFVLMIRELRAVLKIVNDLLEDQRYRMSNEEKLVLSYLIYFYGLGPNSTRILKSTLINYPESLVEKIIQELEFNKEIVKKEKRFNFTPFEGHQSRLGHYYRHLFQSFNFIKNNRLKVDNYEYAKILRAQLSNHEQALLFINSLTFLGRKWWEFELITDYKIVSNVPENFFNPYNEIEMKNYFSADYFEWQI